MEKSKSTFKKLKLTVLSLSLALSGYGFMQSTGQVSAESDPVVINEVNWAGSNASGMDEWIELYNPNSFDVDLDGYTIIQDLGNNFTGSIEITLGDGICSNLMIPAEGYFLVSNYSSNSPNSLLDIQPDCVDDSVTLVNDGLVLYLNDATDSTVDQANDYVVPGDVGTDAAAWPAGSNGALDTSMARTSPSSSGVDPASWVDSSRSLNMDSPFTYELDGNTWTSGWLRNLQMTPGTHNDLRDGSGNMVFCASTMHTNVGNVATDGAASDICGDEVMYYSGDGSGNEAYVSYGPYLDGLTVGQWYQADYRIKVQNNAAGEKSLLLDSSVFPEGADNYEFYYLPTATLYKTYTVKFQKGVDNLHEFRVRTYNKSDIYVDSVTVKEITPPPSEITYQSEDMPSAIASTVISDAQASNGTARSGDTTGFLTFGPYSQDQIERGSYEATFYIKNEGGATGFVGAVDVFQSFGAESKSLAFNIIDDTEVATGSYTAVTLPFELVDQSQGSLEFRIKILQENTFVADKVVVTKV